MISFSDSDDLYNFFTFHCFNMKHFAISSVATCLVLINLSFPFILSDDGSEEDPLDSFLSPSTSTSTSTFTSDIVDDEFTSSLLLTESGVELPLEDYQTESEDWPDTDLDISPQPYSSDLIATSPGICFPKIISASEANMKR